MECKAETGPSGTKLIFESATSGGVQSYSYEVELPDDRILRIVHSSQFDVGAAQRGTPLTSDQVKKIAIDVASRIKA